MVVQELVNLNKDSTHPNPWKPRTPYEMHTIFWQPYKIYKGFPEDIKPLYNPLAQDPFWSKMGVAAWKGFVIGSGLAATDIVLISQVQGVKAQLARYFFVMPPYMAMPISYIATRDAMQNVFGDKNWTYFWAMVAPASIYGAFRNSSTSGIRVFLTMAWIPYVYKANIDTGGAFIYSYDKPVMQDNLIAQSWKIDFPVKMLRDSDREGPSWKKWLDKEKTGAGPDI